MAALRVSSRLPPLERGTTLNDQSPETPEEEQFAQRFGAQLHGIYRSLCGYRQSRDLTIAESAYRHLYNVSGQSIG